jgi:hypothetical protein
VSLKANFIDFQKASISSRHASLEPAWGQTATTKTSDSTSKY